MRLASILLCSLTCLLACAGCGGAGRPPRAPRVPAHIETWAYVDPCHGVGSAQRRLVREWVTYAEAKCATGLGVAVGDCRARGVSYCTSVAYIDPNLDWSGAGLGMVVPSCMHGRAGVQACANEDWFVHKPGRTDRAGRLTWKSPDIGSAYLLDGADASFDRFVTAYAHRVLSRFDALMVDDVGASTREQLFGDADPIYTSSEELRTDAQVQRDHVTLADDLAPRYLQIDNGLSVNPSSLPAFTLLNRPHQVVGLVAEGYPESLESETVASWYSTGLDDIAYLEHAPQLAHDFVVLLGYNPSGSDAARRVQEATVMLGFEPGRIVDWADLDQNAPGPAVWPEEGLYFEQPVQTMQAPIGPACMNGAGGPCDHGHADLELALGSAADEQQGGAGVYRREFEHCFYAGRPIGPCAAIMNDTKRPEVAERSWLTQDYRYEITFAGGEVGRGGHLVLHGARFTPGRTTIAPDDAALLTG
jgi:hypothetical protein